MHFAAIALAIIVLATGVLINSLKHATSYNSRVLAEATENASATEEPEVTEEPKVEAKIENGESSVKINIKSDVESDSSTSQPTHALSDYVYPGAITNSSADTSLNLSSSDDTDKITDWYKKKIIDLGFNVKNTVKTRTNGEVENVVVGAGGSREVKIEITKAKNDSQASIIVSLSS